MKEKRLPHLTGENIGGCENKNESVKMKRDIGPLIKKKFRKKKNRM